jgi:hypothetical protein
MSEFYEHQSDGAQSDDGQAVARHRSHFFKAADDTRERFDERSILVADMARDEVRISFDDPLGDADEFGVGTVVEQQIFAEVLKTTTAEEAILTRSRISGNHTLSYRKPGDLIADGDDITGQFVTEHGRGDDHPGMVAATEDLNIGTAGQRRSNPNQDVSTLYCRNGYRLNLQMFPTVEHGSHHVVIHYDHLCG